MVYKIVVAWGWLRLVPPQVIKHGLEYGKEGGLKNCKLDVAFPLAGNEKIQAEEDLGGEFVKKIIRRGFPGLLHRGLENVVKSSGKEREALT